MPTAQRWAAEARGAEQRAGELATEAQIAGVRRARREAGVVAEEAWRGSLEVKVTLDDAVGRLLTAPKFKADLEWLIGRYLQGAGAAPG